MNGEWTQIGYVAVDSGQLLLCDPAYIDSEWVHEEQDDFENPRAPFCYSACSKATMSEQRYGQLNFLLGHPGVGVCFASGIGDGLYPVYAKFDGVRIAEIKVVMLPHPVLGTQKEAFKRILRR
jgi:hypothetical protein